MKLIIQISFLALLSCNYSETIEEEKFESSKWKNFKYSRQSMLKDIIENKLLMNKSKEEVIEILGKPTEIGPCDNCIGYSTYKHDEDFSLDHKVLEINFDKQNKVISVRKNSW